jgi:predicted lipid-binding transport protein (Tim44 family)
MILSPYLAALFGGMAIGLAAALMMTLDGRVAGVSGILSSLWADIERRAGRECSFPHPPAVRARLLSRHRGRRGL